MLEIRNIHAYNDAGERLRRRYYSWISDNANEARRTDTLTQFTFPINVLISPLCPTTRIGWASGHFGLVFVENRR